MIRIEVLRNDQVPQPVYEAVSCILYDAFEERRKQNIDFRCGTFSPKDVEKDLEGESYLLIAYNDEEAVGTASLKIRKKWIFRYGTFENLGVLSSYKRKGIATQLANERIKLAEDLNLDFLASTTACNATSSVCYHKKMGFYIYMKSYGLGYDSYSFIKPLKKLNFLKFEPFRVLVYYIVTALNKIK